MGSLTDVQIRAWIKTGKHFEGKADGSGLYLRFPERFQHPTWRFRYRIAGSRRIMELGSYSDLSLAQARKLVAQLNAKVTLGIDPKFERADRVREVAERIDNEARTGRYLADQYCAKYVDGKLKHPEIVRRRIERDMLPVIGNLAVAEVKPQHVDRILKDVLKRGAPTVANNVLRIGTKLFNYALKREWVQANVFAAFELDDAGGTGKPRDRWLSREELKAIFAAMQLAKGWSTENDATIRLLILLAVRKSELTAARKDEFNLDDAVWYLPGDRTKTGKPIDIPLPLQAVELLGRLYSLSGNSDYLLPARKSQTRMLPHIAPDTINSAFKRFIKVDIPSFTIHDFRRTARTHLEAIGVSPRVAEKCLNHQIKGVEAVYNRHAYFDERRQALQSWADLLDEIENEAHSMPMSQAN